MYARAEGREDADRLDLDPAMLICHGDGRFGLELKMQMVKFERLPISATRTKKRASLVASPFAEIGNYIRFASRHP
jgi:hypothetical protein